LTKNRKNLVVWLFLDKIPYELSAHSTKFLRHPHLAHSISLSWNIVKMTLDPHVVPACGPSW